MSKFNRSGALNKTTNLAGGKAFSIDSKTELVHAVLTTFLEDKFYEKGEDRQTRIINLVAQNKPEFVANLAVVARKEFNLRSVSHLLLGELSRVHRGDSLVKDAVVSAAIRVDDLTEMASYLEGKLPKQMKRGIRNALLKFSRYQLAKYRGEGKEISLVDLFNLTHPKPEFANAEQKKAWKDLVEGDLISFDTWETDISNAKDDKSRTKAWQDLIFEGKLGYMALIRNLNNFIKYDISEKAINAVVKTLTDPEEVKNSKQLPFRYVTAYKNVSGNRKFTDAISKAMDVAVSNTPVLKGKTLIAIDTSGSMGGDPIQKAAIFGATLAKANKNADVILYDTSVKELTITSRMPVIDLAEKIERDAMGRGTNTALTFAHALAQGKKYDRFIIISDNESWAGNTQAMYTEYKKETGGDPFVYAIDIQGYGTKDITGKRVFHLGGWSDRLLDFIGRIEEGTTLIDYIEDYKIERKINNIKKPKKVVAKKKKKTSK